MYLTKIKILIAGEFGDKHYEMTIGCEKMMGYALCYSHDQYEPTTDLTDLIIRKNYPRIEFEGKFYSNADYQVEGTHLSINLNNYNTDSNEKED